MTKSTLDNVFGAAIMRNGKRWQATVETNDGQWTPYCDGKTPALALANALDRVTTDDEPATTTKNADQDDLDFG
jgi:hypothetical protein